MSSNSWDFGSTYVSGPHVKSVICSKQNQKIGYFSSQDTDCSPSYVYSTLTVFHLGILSPHKGKY